MREANEIKGECCFRHGNLIDLSHIYGASIYQEEALEII